MLLSKACKEVLEGVLLFMVHQYGHLSTATTRTLQPRVFLEIFTEESAEVVTWSVKVDASDLGVYFLDGNLFLNKLCGRGSSVRGFLDAALNSSGERGEIVVLSRRIGDYTTVQQHTAVKRDTETGDTQTTSGTSSSVTVEDTVLQRPSDFPPSGLRVCFQGRCTLGDMKKGAHTLSVHMHYLHLINPDIELGLLVMASSEVLMRSQFLREPGWHPLSTSPHTLTTSLHHYSSAATKQTKLKLSRGLSFTLQPLTLRAGSQLTLRLYCSAGVVPHLSLCKGRKIPANRTCRELRVFVFGPSSLPIVDVGSLSSLSLCSLADWESYGLTLTQTGSATEHSEGSELSSGCCRLSNNRSVPVNSNPERRSRTKCDRSLVLFVFLEDTAASRNTGAVGHCTTHYWEQQMDRVCELREMLDGLLQSQQKKFKQATHSVLNKLLCNYGTHIKTASVLHSTLPQLADAVASIIGNSSNDHFKQRCRNMLQVPNETEKESISKKLWEIAEKQLYISKTQTTFPQEPPSPELEQAASENSPPTTTDAAPTTNSHQTPLTSTPAAAAVYGRNKQPLGGEGDDERKQSSHQQNSESGVNSRKYSLFQAMINSKRAKRNGVSSQSTTSTSMPSVRVPCASTPLVETSSFEALAELAEEPHDPDPQSRRNCVPLSSGVLPSSECAASLSPSSHPDVQFNTSSVPSEVEDTCFEDLAAVIDDAECTVPSIQASAMDTVQLSLEESACSAILQSDGDSATDMDWGDETDGGEFDDLDAGFSDFSASPANDSEDEGDTATHEVVKRGSEQQWRTSEACIEEPTVLTRADQDGTNVLQGSQNSTQSEVFLAVHRDCDSRHQREGETECSISLLNHTTPSDTSHASTSFTSTVDTNTTCASTVDTNTTCHHTTTDSDWEQLGELLEDRDVERTRLGLPPSAKLPSQLEPDVIGSVPATVVTRPRTTSATVPDISHRGVAMDITEEDFLWD